MLNRSPRPCQTSRRAIYAALLALLACSHASAQIDGSVESGTPYYSSGSGTARLGNTPLRIWHSTKQYAQEEAETAFGGRLATDIASGIAFVDGQFRMSNTSDFGLNVGVGVRLRHTGLMTGDPRIFGVSGWYDGDETNMKNFFSQAGLSLESLGNMVDLRFNASFAPDDVELGDVTTTGDVMFEGNNLTQIMVTPADVALDNIHTEIAVRVPDTNVWGYASGYTLQGEGFHTTGFKLGARGYVYNDLVLDLGVSDDDSFGTLVSFQAIWMPGRSGAGVSRCIQRIGDRMREPVYRPYYVATRQQIVETDVQTVNDLDGNAVRVVHVDSNATAPGDGTFERPLTSFNNIASTSVEGDIILVHSNSTYTGQSTTLDNDQRLLGEGGNVAHTVATSNFGTLTLPETSTGAGAGAIPQINGAATAITVSDASAPDPSLGPIEVNNLAVTGGNVGILSTATGTGVLNVRNVSIADTTSNGVQLTGSSWTHNMTNVNITDAGDAVGEAGMLVDGGSANVTFTGRITQSNAASAFAVQGGHTGTMNMSEATAGAGLIDATSGDGLQFTNADGVYTFNHKVELHGGDAGIDVTGDSDGTMTFADAEIVDPTGTAINIAGGDASMTYTGFVKQSNANQTALSVTGGHNGTLVFNQQNAADGSFDVTSGDGLQFTDAHGAYTFNDEVALNGEDAGIDVVTSNGIFTFADASINNPTGDGVHIDGGDSNAVFTYTGSITQTANNAAAVSIEGGHDGSVVFNGGTAGAKVVRATVGPGLQFDNADGDYVFNDMVELNGGNAAIDVINGSAGTITFANAQITNPNDIAVNVVGGQANLNFTGKITQGGNFAAVSVTGQHTGTMNFTESTAGQGVVEATNGTGLQFDNADGTYAFNDAVVLNGGDAGIDVTNDSSGTFTFDAASRITNPTGTALNVDGGNAVVTYRGNITNNAGRAVVIDSNTGGSVLVSGTTTDAADGVLVQNNSGGTYTFSGATNITPAAAGAQPAFQVSGNNGGNVIVSGATNVTTTGNQTAVSVANNTAGNTRFTNLTINTAAGTGFLADSITGTATLEATGTNTITTATGLGLSMNNVRIGASNFAVASVNANGGVNAIDLQDVTGGSVNIGGSSTAFGDGGTIQNMTGDAINVANVANVTFNGLDITNTTGDAINLAHSSSATSSMTVRNSRVTTATGLGIDFNNSGSEATTLVVTGNNISATTGAGIALNVANTPTTNVTINNNTVANTAAAEALRINSSGVTIKTINLLVSGNTLSNNDATAAAAEITASGNTIVNATINSNALSNTNAGGGLPFRMETADGSAVAKLTMTGNTATTSVAGDQYVLVETLGEFTVKNLTTAPTIDTVNTGTFNIDAGITEEAGNIPLP